MESAEAADARFMQRALELALRGAGQVAPNPLVGAVVVRDGRVVGEGWHARYGGAHAEVAALAAAGDAAIGATIYVTLEPCHHHGQTPPCTAALRDARVARVVYATTDPNPVAAGGAHWLREQGMRVHAGVGEREARDLNAAFFFCQHNTTRPFVTLKLALSIDGAVVDASRRRAWLTGPESRAAVHALRADSDAVAVGIGTVLSDDPLLTVREGSTPRVAPRRVVFDRRARLPLDAMLVRTARALRVTVITDGSEAHAEQVLRDAGVDIRAVASLTAGLRGLRMDGVRHLLVEGGASMASALMAAGFVDRLVTFQAPVILGAGALPAFAALPSQAVDTAPRLRVVARRACGTDLMTTYAVFGD